MNRLPERNSAGAMMAVSMAARLFIGMSIEHTQAGSASWMCPILGMLISLPIFLCMQTLPAFGKDSLIEGILETLPKWTVGVFIVPLALFPAADCAYVSRLAANTANITALNNVTTPFLVLPVAIGIGIMILFGAAAAGRSARIWMKILPVPLAVIIAVQIKMYVPSWLLPVLGGGIRSLIENSLECAGIIALFALVGMISVPEKRDSTFYKHVFIAVGAASVLLMLFQMLAPVRTEIELSRASRLKMILSNGRVALILQIVMVTVWYGSLLHIISAEAVTASAILERLIPQIGVPVWAAFFALGIGIFASLEPVENPAFRGLERYRFPAVGALLLILFTLYYFASRRKRNA